ncbi:hypothetical protein [Planctomyces sp. SH-PL14]|uniref:hypothetical protein n=1 Tax=Planctomyces sp. SH-PL14 TaxID=1632864 RepID=UPI00078CEAF6|nr:hypothetical protein [Planctomyces sp. SH-PL14]AMV16420.1 hypothetical protein VT03_00930 [Planctomyces sp. SH-PL14]
MPSVSTDEPQPASSNSSRASQRLRTTMAATRVSFTWMGVRKTLSQEQKAQAADQFDAEAKYVSASKKLLDTRHPQFRAVTGVRGKIVQFWKSQTLPYPEAGVRLIPQKAIGRFDEILSEYRRELNDAVVGLDDVYSELRSAARDRLGRLFNASDYPVSMRDEFAVSWDFPAVEPPNYLQQLNPALYEQESLRVQARFDEAVQLAEQAFLDELSRLVEHLTERLSGSDDGKPKVFRDSAIENLSEFFDRFRRLNIHSSDELDAVVERARNLVSQVQPQQLRDDAPLRSRIASQLSNVQASLDGLMVDRPRRSIIRPTRPEST